jgi:hypothetical protein
MATRAKIPTVVRNVVTVVKNVVTRTINAPDFFDPFLFHGPCAVATFSADDGPIDSGHVEIAKILKKGLYRKKADRRRDRPQVLDSRQSLTPVFYADAPPYMTVVGSKM